MFIVPLLMPNVLRVEWRAFLAPVRRGAHGFYNLEILMAEYFAGRVLYSSSLAEYFACGDVTTTSF